MKPRVPIFFILMGTFVSRMLQTAPVIAAIKTALVWAIGMGLWIRAGYGIAWLLTYGVVFGWYVWIAFWGFVLAQCVWRGRQVRDVASDRGSA